MKVMGSQVHAIEKAIRPLVQIRSHIPDTFNLFVFQAAIDFWLNYGSSCIVVECPSEKNYSFFVEVPNMVYCLLDS